MRLALFLPLMLMPGQADAAGLAVAVATTISIAKWLFLILGVASMARVVLAASNGESITKSLWVPVAATLVPTVIFAFLGHLNSLNPTPLPVGATHVGGRPWLEYVLSQVGLLNSTRVYVWIKSHGLEVATVLIASAVAFSMAWARGDWASFRRWILVSGMILAVFWPGWTHRAANSTQAVIQSHGGSIQTFQNIPAGQTPKSQGGSVVGSITAIQIHPSTKKLSSNSEAPVVLSLINQAFDDIVGGVAGVIGGSKFLAFGMRNSVSFSKMLGSSIQNSDIRDQAKFFMSNCYFPFINQVGGGQKGLTAFLKDPSANAGKMHIFGPAAMSFYASSKVDVSTGGQGQLTTCAKIATGAHDLYGLHWTHGLRDLIVADLAWQDPWLTKKYKWRGPNDALASVQRLKREDYGTIWSTNSVVRNYHSTNAADALVDQMMRKESFAFGYNFKSATGAGNDPKYSRDVYGWLTKLAVFGTSTVGNIKGAIQAESVNAKLPAFMSIIQLLVLSLYPLVWLFSLFPGQGKHLIDYFLLLFWSKSYVIGLSAISVLDQQIGLYNPAGITDNPNDTLLLVSVVQQATWLSPLLMAGVVFGFRAAAQGGLARGAG